MNKKWIYELMSDFDKKEEKESMILAFEEEIESLNWAKSNIWAFLWLLESHKKMNFIGFLKNNIYQLYFFISKFIKYNEKIIIKEINNNNNLYIKYFIELIAYFFDKKTIWSLELFNNSKIDKIDSYLEEEKELYFFINEKIFFNKLIIEIDKLIDSIIDELEDELFKEKNGILEWEIILVEGLVLDALMIEDKITNYINDFDKIFFELYSKKDYIIAIVLNKNDLLERLENIIYFIK